MKSVIITILCKDSNNIVNVEVYENDVVTETFPSTMYKALSIFRFWSGGIKDEETCMFGSSDYLNKEEIDSLRISTN